jgi:hypothetical protein
MMFVSSVVISHYYELINVVVDGEVAMKDIVPTKTITSILSLSIEMENTTRFYNAEPLLVLIIL